MLKYILAALIGAVICGISILIIKVLYMNRNREILRKVNGVKKLLRGASRQEKDYEWFLDNFLDLYNRYGQSFLAIKNKTVIGVYTSFHEAIENTRLTEELGTFIIQECSPRALEPQHFFAWRNVSFDSVNL